MLIDFFLYIWMIVCVIKLVIDNFLVLDGLWFLFKWIEFVMINFFIVEFLICFLVGFDKIGCV